MVQHGQLLGGSRIESLRTRHALQNLSEEHVDNLPVPRTQQHLPNGPCCAHIHNAEATAAHDAQIRARRQRTRSAAAGLIDDMAGVSDEEEEMSEDDLEALVGAEESIEASSDAEGVRRGMKATLPLAFVHEGAAVPALPKVVGNVDSYRHHEVLVLLAEWLKMDVFEVAGKLLTLSASQRLEIRRDYAAEHQAVPSVPDFELN